MLSIDPWHEAVKHTSQWLHLYKQYVTKVTDIRFTRKVIPSAFATPCIYTIQDVMNVHD
jgi:hypothetical protein